MRRIPALERLPANVRPFRAAELVEQLASGALDKDTLTALLAAHIVPL